MCHGQALVAQHENVSVVRATAQTACVHPTQHNRYDQQGIGNYIAPCLLVPYVFPPSHHMYKIYDIRSPPFGFQRRPPEQHSLDSKTAGRSPLCWPQVPVPFFRSSISRSSRFSFFLCLSPIIFSLCPYASLPFPLSLSLSWGRQRGPVRHSKASSGGWAKNFPPGAP